MSKVDQECEIYLLSQPLCVNSFMLAEIYSLNNLLETCIVYGKETPLHELETQFAFGKSNPSNLINIITYKMIFIRWYKS